MEHAYEKPISKVLILDSRQEESKKIRSFCEKRNLVPAKVNSEHIISVLSSKIFLGAVFLCEEFDRNHGDARSLGEVIHALRPELPIFLRSNQTQNVKDSGDDGHQFFAARYHSDFIERLNPLIDQYIFSMVYPYPLVRGIAEISKLALESQFKGLEVQVKRPHLVRDRIIYGDIFTLIPIDTNWCRGYMMLQCEEKDMLRLVNLHTTHIQSDGDNDFRSSNAVLGETTNMIWGAFKNRYVTDDYGSSYIAQVPIIANQANRYITFGSQEPHLCHKYKLIDSETKEPVLKIVQHFIFNLSWIPEEFKENDQSMNQLVDSGELEMF